MQEPKPPVVEPYTFVFSWKRFFVHCAIMSFCVFLGLMTWYLGKPPSIRFYETKSEAPLTAPLAPGINMALDMRSTIAVKESEPLQVELFKGNVFFDIQKNAINQLEIKVGNTLIKDFGTRFSIQLHKDGSGHIAVTEGHIKIHTPSGSVFQINALEEAEFDDTGISKHRLLSERNIAPWHTIQ